MRQSSAIKFEAKGLLSLVALLALTVGGQPLQAIATTPTTAKPVVQVSKTVAELVLAAKSEFHQGFYTDAIANYDSAIKLEPNNAELYKLRGEAHKQRGIDRRSESNSVGLKQEYQSAIADYDMAIKLRPNDIDAYKRRGDVRREFGDTTGAAADYAQAPKAAERLFQSAQKSISRSDYDGAIQELDQLIEFNPNIASAYFLRGGAYAAMGNARLAERDFGDAIRLQPNFAQAYANRGAIRYRTNDYTGAIADFEQAIKLKPDYADAKSGLTLARATVEKEGKMDAVDFNKRGREKTRQQDYRGAIADFNQAIKLKPSGAAFYANRGVAYNAIGNNKSALADFDQAIKLQSDWALYYRYRGGVRSALGDKPGTIADYQKAADLYQAENDPKNRQDMLDQIKKLQP
jgi:tetratricopeptide (TPR) repeat protein